MRTLLMLIPEEAYGLILLGVCLAALFGLMRPARAYVIAVIFCLIIAASPLLETLIDQLPDWAFLLLCLWLVITLIGAVFGKRVMENVLSMVLFGLLVFPFRLLLRFLWPRRLH
ncbi:MAG: hypothetical protein EHM49_10285 [Deltaproteobacteria bacterium]|nr:MAG: hypothetical protein EHM49_10285 [Deltaproteobacteria bacterium]